LDGTASAAKISTDEDVVDAERFLDQVSGEELERDLLPAPGIQSQIEEQRQADPDGAPDRRLAKADLVRAAAEDAQIQREHRHDESREAQPEEERGLAHEMRSLAI